MSEEQKRLIEETVENLKHLDKESLLVVKGSFNLNLGWLDSCIIALMESIVLSNCPTTFCKYNRILALSYLR